MRGGIGGGWIFAEEARWTPQRGVFSIATNGEMVVTVLDFCGSASLFLCAGCSSHSTKSRDYSSGKPSNGRTQHKGDRGCGK